MYNLQIVRALILTIELVNKMQNWGSWIEFIINYCHFRPFRGRFETVFGPCGAPRSKKFLPMVAILCLGTYTSELVQEKLSRGSYGAVIAKNVIFHQVF